MRQELLDRIEKERLRQLDIPGSEFDLTNTPNEWAAIAAHYLTEDVRRGGYKPTRESFEDSFIKAAAVILAALECSQTMEELGLFENSEPSLLNDTLTAINEKNIKNA